MSNRIVRINELVQRELNAYLRKRYQSESAAITVTSVEIAPDLKTGKVFVSIIGNETAVQERMDWLRNRAGELRREVGHHIVLKWTPLLDYVLDDSPARAARVMQVLDEIEQREKAAGHAAPPVSGTSDPMTKDMGGTPMPRGTGVPPVGSSGHSKPDLPPSDSTLRPE